MTQHTGTQLTFEEKKEITFQIKELEKELDE